MQVAIDLADAYEKAYEHTRRQLMTQPKGKQFDFNKDVVFEKFNHFKRRLEKLVDMFTTIHQFSSLEQHTHIDGLTGMIANFHQIVGDVRNKGLDLLNFYSTQFDRDYLEFNVNIHDLEMNLQSFINKSFENISSTDHALNLLEQIQSILKRDTLKSDLEAKYMIIFQNYGLDLDAVQKNYEKHKVSIGCPDSFARTLSSFPRMSVLMQVVSIAALTVGSPVLVFPTSLLPFFDAPLQYCILFYHCIQSTVVVPGCT
jgi:dynein heavy chain